MSAAEERDRAVEELESLRFAARAVIEKTIAGGDWHAFDYFVKLVNDGGTFTPRVLITGQVQGARWALDEVRRVARFDASVWGIEPEALCTEARDAAWNRAVHNISYGAKK